MWEELELQMALILKEEDVPVLTKSGKEEVDMQLIRDYPAMVGE